MTTILSVVEIGAGLSHTNALLQIAALTAARGYTNVFALTRSNAANPRVAESGIPVLPAPELGVVPPPYAGPFRARSAADTLAYYGFADRARLLASVSAWDHLFSFVKPALVIADQAPFAALAAYGVVPVAAVGGTEAVPPIAAMHCPVIDESAAVHTAEERLLDNVAWVQHRRSRPVPPALPAITGGNFAAVRSLPETDLYRDLRTTELIGPVEKLPPLLPRPGRRQAFAYFTALHPDFPVMLESFARMTMPLTLVIHPPSPRHAELMTRRGIVVHPQAPPLAAALAEADLVISHGGAGMAAAALAAGRPHIAVPMWPADRLKLRNIAGDGLVEMLPGPLPDLIPSLCEAMVDDAALAARLDAKARDIAGRGYDRMAQRVAAACMALAG